MKPFITASLALGAVLLGAAQVSAKLPPPSEEAKAKAAETAAKAAWTDKVGAYQLCLSMDKVAARYLADAVKAGKAVQPTPTPPCTDPGPFAHTAPAAPAATAPATTPTPPGSKPLEAAGAHSPPGNVVSPPSTKTPAAEQASAKKP